MTGGVGKYEGGAVKNMPGGLEKMRGGVKNKMYGGASAGQSIMSIPAMHI